jgi:hypothetical protein
VGRLGSPGPASPGAGELRGLDDPIGHRGREAGETAPGLRRTPPAPARGRGRSGLGMAESRQTRGVASRGRSGLSGGRGGRCQPAGPGDAGSVVALAPRGPGRSGGGPGCARRTRRPGRGSVHAAGIAAGRANRSWGSSGAALGVCASAHRRTRGMFDGERPAGPRVVGLGPALGPACSRPGARLEAACGEGRGPRGELRGPVAGRNGLLRSGDGRREPGRSGAGSAPAVEQGLELGPGAEDQEGEPVVGGARLRLDQQEGLPTVPALPG